MHFTTFSERRTSLKARIKLTFRLRGELCERIYRVKKIMLLQAIRIRSRDLGGLLISRGNGSSFMQLSSVTHIKYIRLVFTGSLKQFCSIIASVIWLVLPTAVLLIMAALRAGRYFLPCGFYLLSSSSSFFPRLISAAADWMSTILPHMVWP